MSTTQFDLWSKAVRTRDEIRTKLRSHYAGCPDCDPRTGKFCRDAMPIFTALARAENAVKRHSGPYGNPNIERYG